MTTDNEKEYINSLNKAGQAISKDLYDQKTKFVEQYRTAMKDMALISATLAGASLFLIGTEIPRFLSFVLIGITLLICVILYTYFYIFKVIAKNSSGLKELKTNYLNKIYNILELYEAAKSEKLTWVEYQKQNNEILETMRKSHKGLKNSTESDKNFSTDKSGWITYSLFFLGLSFISIGLIAPHISISININQANLRQTNIEKCTNMIH